MMNKEMAAIFFNIATVLWGQGNASPFRTAAYERGARALMGLERSAEVVPFPPRQHIGKRLQAKIREMAAPDSPQDQAAAPAAASVTVTHQQQGVLFDLSRGI